MNKAITTSTVVTISVITTAVTTTSKHIHRICSNHEIEDCVQYRPDKTYMICTIIPLYKHNIPLYHYTIIQLYNSI